MKMQRKQKNKNWPAIVRGTIDCVSCSERRNMGYMVYRLVGDDLDAQALVPLREYRTKAACQKASEKLGWTIAN